VLFFKLDLPNRLAAELLTWGHDFDDEDEDGTEAA
jgi:hypothetical protein